MHDARAFETRVLDMLRGTFVAVTEGPLPRRLYPDCAATLPIVYCAADRRGASSAGMLFEREEYRARFLSDRHRRLIELEEGEPWIAGTLTAHRGVSRLLANHYLDLVSWRAHRFWPRRGEIAPRLSLEGAVEIVAERMQGFLHAAVAAYPGRVGMALTAGYDSRLMLAAARGVAHDIAFFTLTPPRPGLDQIMAQKIAADLGLNHRLVPILEASEAERTAWDVAVGHTLRHANRVVHPSLRQLDCDLILTGILGETGRPRLYAYDVERIDARPATPALVLTRMALPQDTELLLDTEDWLSEIDWLPTSTILDLAVLERFYMSAWRPAQCAEIPELMPFVDHAVQSAFLSVSPQDRAGDRFFRATIVRLWPEALALPINRYGDYRDPLSRLGKVFQRGRLAAFVRRRMA